MPDYNGKYRSKLRFISVDRIVDNEDETDWFYFEEDEEIVEVLWLPSSVSVTLAKTEWSRKFPPSPESTQGE